MTTSIHSPSGKADRTFCRYLANSADGSQYHWMENGGRVRVHAPSIQRRRIVGRLVRVTQDTILIDGKRRTYGVPLASISSLEVSTKRSRRPVEAVLLGVAIGSGVFFQRRRFIE